MIQIDFLSIIREAWIAFDYTRPIAHITDLSVRVSTNNVFKVDLEDGDAVYAKLSYFGRYEHFVEDHSIINVLANNLSSPYDNMLARSLMKRTDLFVYRVTQNALDAWVVFYRPVPIGQMLDKRQDEEMICKLGRAMAHFHLACYRTRRSLPPSSKTMISDLDHLLQILGTKDGQFEHRGYVDLIHDQVKQFKSNFALYAHPEIHSIPIFVDWNIGNFSMTPEGYFYSRWDYDWFRVSYRIMDFYFMARVVSDIGDRTVFSYLIDPLEEDRFLLFLKHYHEVFPLTKSEILLLPEIYRFFILNYVLKDGRYFFHEVFATKLQREAYELYLPSIEKQLDTRRIIEALKL